MIKGLQGDSYIVVSGGSTSLPYVPMNNENPIQGMIRVWGTDLQVFNGSNWTVMPSSYATAGVAPKYQQALDWAHRKMIEEIEMKKLAEHHPAIADLVDAVAKAEEQLRMAVALVTI
jgi:hypothetical protein